MTQIPAHLGELNDEWLTHAMRSSGYIGATGEVTGHTASRIGEGAGFLGDLARIEINYSGANDGAPTTMIAKFPTEKPENRGFGVMLGAYENEIRFYDELAAQMPVSVPDCYFGALDPEARSSAVVGKVVGWLPSAITPRLMDRLTLAAGSSDRGFGLLSRGPRRSPRWRPGWRLWPRGGRARVDRLGGDACHVLGEPRPRSPLGPAGG